MVAAFRQPTTSSKFGKYEIQSLLQRNGFVTILLGSSPFSILGMKDGKGYLFSICSHGKKVPNVISTARDYTDHNPHRIIICVKSNSQYQFKELLPGGLVPFSLVPDGNE